MDLRYLAVGAVLPNLVDLPLALALGEGSEMLQPLAVTIVSGLPRSGTSMMMQMLEAAGCRCSPTGFGDGRKLK